MPQGGPPRKRPHKKQAVKLPNTAPFKAAMTRTAVQSPQIKSVFQAQIRHSGFRDLVIVRETSIEVKEFFIELERTFDDDKEPVDQERSYQLSNIAIRSNFDGKILAATQVPILKPKGREALRASRAAEAGAQENSLSDHEDHELRKGGRLPPDLLVLLLRSGLNAWLTFLFMEETSLGSYKFIYHDVPLMSPDRRGADPWQGLFLIVDPL